MQKLHLDFETVSERDLPKTGVHEYAGDKSTDFLCMAFALDTDGNEGPVELITRGQPLPHWVEAFVTDGELVVAHNAAFELAIWNLCCVPKYGWPKLRIEQVDCTMVRAYSMGLPGKLENVAPALGLDVQKDMAGHRVMMQLSQPRKRHKDGTITWWEPSEVPEKYDHLYRYCKNDVAVERSVDKRLLPLSKAERKLWFFDQYVNNRGVAVDKAAAKKAIAIVDMEQRRLDVEIREISGNQISTYRSPTDIKRYLAASGFVTKGVAKNDVIELLARTDLPLDCRRALEIRQEAAKSSTAKLVAMLNRASVDGRIRGIFQFYGAGTGRWAGRGIQPQNFPRPSIDQDEVEEVFKILLQHSPEEAREMIEMFHGSPMTVISDCLRGFLYSPKGDLICMDFSAIEARVVAWLAGQESVLEIFRTHGMIYEDQAARTFGIRLEDVTKYLRQIGKVEVLGLGFQGGVIALQKMAKAYNVSMAGALRSLWERADGERRTAVMKRWKSDGVDSGIEKKEWIASELIKLSWRDANPSIVRYWSLVEAAAMRAVQTGEASDVLGGGPPVKWLKKGSFLFCKLPSGRNLCYPYPKVEEKMTKWGTPRRSLTYMTEDSTIRKWIRVGAYGGLLVENITQAVARDLLADAMLRLQEKKYNVVMHVHDEAVIEVSKDQGSEEEVQHIVSEVPAWAAGLPIAAEGWRGERYRK